jgi:predicted acyl esterase
VRAFFAQVGGSSIYDDVVYEGQSIEMERLWLWVAGNIAGLSAFHRDAVARRFGLSAAELAAIADSARARTAALNAARQANPPFIESAEWMHLPLIGYPDFSVMQPHLDEILRHPAPDEFRARHNFRATINIPGFHVTTWFDIFQTSVIAAFRHLTPVLVTSVCGLDLTTTTSSMRPGSGHAIRTSNGSITGSKASIRGLWMSRRSFIRPERGSPTR